VTLEGGLDVLFAGDDNVFVAGDLFWYPVEGRPDICQAPDALVVFGRPKEDRLSYKQWEEDNIAPQVVFEVLSPSNRSSEMIRKLKFYELHGVEEYYTFDPDNNELCGYQRDGSGLREIAQMQGWISPRMKIRFELADGHLHVYGPDNREFATYRELAAQRDQAERERDELRAQLKALGIEPKT
jgi:Uma2 family endonuclease